MKIAFLLLFMLLAVPEFSRLCLKNHQAGSSLCLSVSVVNKFLSENQPQRHRGTEKSVHNRLLGQSQFSIVRAQKTDRYSCPMHPDVVYSKPGKCPKCGMTLVKQGAPAQTKADPEPAAEPKSSSGAFSSTKIPDAQVLDQNGN